MDWKECIAKNKDKIKEAILSLKKEFEILNDYNLEDFEFTTENIELVKRIFDTLSKTVLKSTGTTKLMHGMNPDLFVMWDKGIYEHYGYYPNSVGYIHYLKLMQEEARRILKEHSKEEIISNFNRTIPKLIDEYNWANYRTSKTKG